jgi:hypothetical protein
MRSINRTAKVAGALYLIYIVVWVLADALATSPLIVSGDAAVTAANLAAHAMQFRLGFVGNLLGGALFLLTAWALYRLLKPVNADLALLFLLLNLTGVAIQCASELNLLAALQLAIGANTLQVFSDGQRQALAMSLLDLRESGFWISQIFEGAWLFPLGYAIYKSGYLPRWLGILFMVHCFSWTITALLALLFPGFTAFTYVSYPLGFAAEFGLSLWLLIKGVNLTAWESRVSASA